MTRTSLVRDAPCCGSLTLFEEAACGLRGGMPGNPVASARGMRRAGSRGFQVRSEGSVFFAGVRICGDNCAKIHDEHAVMMPTHRNVA